MATGRKLKLKKRAERMEETRRRIAHATYELHCTLGPAKTTISAIAERAGVQRLTVYHHFPHERDLLQACTQYGLALDPPPDPTAWRQVADPLRRLRQGLRELYAYFRRNESLLSNVSRDAPLMLPRYGGDVPEAIAAFLALPTQLGDALAQDWTADPAPPLLLASLGLAVDFQTWHTLVRRQGLDDAQAVELMVRLACCVSAPNEQQPQRALPSSQKASEGPARVAY
jgi:AcrR family transcriptional regulator